ncbi:MarR family winged helix-turn-helix transcriptional regulator [Nakamurella lactea]|uniref:MarR family winged helix-turn-helix transcriptional regulator n=1 Tax=Nakamurella lactea TaxID=459515 RepID=UPI001B7FB5FE|nr:MarR family transcriptional regulator [Nakamurella lactea]
MTENLRLFETLVRIETRLWNQLDRALIAEHGFTLGQVVALRLLKAAPGSRVQDLAEALDISPGGASKLADRLVGAGLVDRVVDDTDRRASRLRLNEQGSRVVEAGSATGERWLRDRFGVSLGRHGVGELQSLLTALSEQQRTEDVLA